MLHHPWFTSGPIPSHISSSTLLSRPEYPEMSEEQIKVNFGRVKRKAAVGANLPLGVPKAEVVATPQEVGKEVEKAVREQEREFTKAVQPDSPISALLRYVQVATTVLTFQD
jgi:cell cycle serine/threonine-protein kinase CDC5/MSD2